MSKLIDLRQILGEDNKPLTKMWVITPQDYKELAKLAPKLTRFFQSSEGQKIAHMEGWTASQKLEEAFRILQEQEGSLH